MTIDTYAAQLWRKYRKRFTQNLNRSTIPPSMLERFAAQPLRMLILTEPYCDDSAQFVPVVWKLEQDIANLDVRILRQSEHPDLADRYLADAGHPAIPTFILMNDRFNELGALIERPRRVTADMIDETRRFQEANPTLPGIRRNVDRMPDETQAQLKQHIATWRDSQHDLWAGYLLEDLLAVVEH